MTIWILALVLLAAGAGLGLRQGAIRTAISFVGIVSAVLFAGILGNLIKPLWPHVGIQNPTLIWALAPLVAFIIVLILFKVAAFFVHRKVYLFYKYKAGDLRMALWERLNSRLGLCLGLLNGTAYLLLVSFVIFNLAYWTIQVAPSSNESVAIRVINRMGADLGTSGLAGAARSLVPLPDLYYQLADLAGLLRQNPGLKDRLEKYPAFLSLGERDDFKQLGQDSGFQSAWESSAPIAQFLSDTQVKAMLQNNDLTTMVLGLLQANWTDLNGYLKTGKSQNYDSEKILGRWSFNVNVSVGTLLIARPNLPAAEIKALRNLWSRAYARTILVAAADHQAFLKNWPRFTVENGMPTVAETTTWQGQWNNAGTNYDLSLNGKSMTARTDGLRLTIKSASDVWVFDREQ
ncbi:MAG TPA: CvpA family protein [Candidatus Limnocylindrales bacterium]|nr:CvpA family protein [Candidatus Limnocylindrales bacterium]